MVGRHLFGNCNVMDKYAQLYSTDEGCDARMLPRVTNGGFIIGKFNNKQCR
jgi:hypothetical protein